MKCRTCEKEIPETSQVCPFCYSAVVKEEVQPTNLNDTSNLTTINTNTFNTTSDNNELNFGDLNNTSYDSESIKIGEKKTKKIPLGMIIFVFIIILVAVVVGLIFMLTKPKVYEYQYYEGIVNKVYNYLDENIINQDTSNNGKYKFYYTYQGVTKEFKGDYKFDIDKRLLSITGKEKDPEEEKSGIVVGELPTTEFEFVVKNNNFYFYSKDIYETPILLPYEDDLGLLVTKQYEANTLLQGIKDATNKSLKELTYETTKKTTSNGYADKELDKISLKIDYNAKKTFLVTFYDTLLNDSNFITEYAKIKNRSEEDIEKIFKNYKLSYEHKYSSDDGELAYLNIYLKKKEVVRIEYQDVRANTKTQIDLGKNDIKITNYEEDQEVLSINISKIDKTMNDKLTRNYTVDYKKGTETYNFNLELEKEENTTVKVNEIENAVSIRDLNEENLNTIKTNIKPYINNTEFIDKLPKTFGTKCTSDLKCVCNTNSCSCELNDRIIECPLGTVPQSN